MRRFIYTNVLGKSIEFNRETGFMLTSIDSLSSNDVTINEVSGSSQVGATATSQKIVPKTITFEGDFPYSWSRRRTLIDTIAPGINARIRMIDEDNNFDVFIDGMPKRSPYISEDKVYQTFQFQFYCPFPFWQETSYTNLKFTQYISHFRFPRSFSNTVYWKISERQMLVIDTIENRGTLPTGFEVTFKAETAVTSPELLNIETQEILKMSSDFVLQAGDTLVISTYEGRKTVTWTRAETGKPENAFQYLTDESVFWQLQPGDNIVRYGADDNYEGLEVDISLNITYAGV